MKQIDSLVKLERAGCGGLLYLPYLNGTSSFVASPFMHKPHSVHVKFELAIGMK
jgi:hypothetical protein